MVRERIYGKCQNDLCGRQLAEDAGYQSKFYLRETGLIQNKYRTAGPRLSAVDFREDAVNRLVESTVADNNSVIVHIVSTFSQDLPKVVCMGGFDIDKVAFAIEAQGLGAFPVQPAPRRFGFFQRNCSPGVCISLKNP